MQCSRNKIEIKAPTNLPKGEAKENYMDSNKINITPASLSPGEGRGEAKQEFNITVYTENQIGLLNRIAIIFTRRKINIDSLNTSPSEIESIHRFNIVV